MKMIIQNVTRETKILNVYTLYKRVPWKHVIPLQQSSISLQQHGMGLKKTKHKKKSSDLNVTILEMFSK